MFYNELLLFTHGTPLILFFTVTLLEKNVPWEKSERTFYRHSYFYILPPTSDTPLILFLDVTSLLSECVMGRKSERTDKAKARELNNNEEAFVTNLTTADHTFVVYAAVIGAKMS